MKLEIDNLGEMIATRRGHPIKRSDLWWIIGFAAVLVMLIATGFWQFQSFETNHGAIAAIYRAQPWFLLAYLVFLIFMTVMVYRLSTSRYFLSVYEKGISYRFRGFRSKVIQWEELEGIASANSEDIFFGRKIKHEHQSILYLKSGKLILLDNQVQDMSAIIDQIKEQFYAYIYPRLKESFDNGQEVRFGPVVIHNQSIALAKAMGSEPFLTSPNEPKRMQVFPWSKLSGITVKSGFLVVKSGNSKAKYIPVSQIPNFEIFLKLIEQGVNP